MNPAHRRSSATRVAILVALVVVVGGVFTLVVNARTDRAERPVASGGLGAAASVVPDPIRLSPQGRHPQFVVECGLSHAANDDPIVSFGAAGFSHLHEFFGATGTNASSTPADLAGGDTTCENRHDTAAYWVPALYDGDTRIPPSELIAYYRTGPGTDPAEVRPWPFGLVMLAGDPGSEEPQPTGIVGWSCGASDHLTAEPRQCSSRAPLAMRLTFPDCWDGENLDSVDHRRHVAYSGGGGCPASHPVPIVQLISVVRYPYFADPAQLRLASGSTITAHGDVMNAWDIDELEKLTRLCLQRGQICGINSNRTDLQSDIAVERTLPQVEAAASAAPSS